MHALRAACMSRSVYRLQNRLPQLFAQFQATNPAKKGKSATVLTNKEFAVLVALMGLNVDKEDVTSAFGKTTNGDSHMTQTQFTQAMTLLAPRAGLHPPKVHDFFHPINVNLCFRFSLFSQIINNYPVNVSGCR
jgi:hypothetical protein